MLPLGFYFSLEIICFFHVCSVLFAYFDVGSDGLGAVNRSSIFGANGDFVIFFRDLLFRCRLRWSRRRLDQVMIRRAGEKAIASPPARQFYYLSQVHK